MRIRNISMVINHLYLQTSVSDTNQMLAAQNQHFYTFGIVMISFTGNS